MTAYREEPSLGWVGERPKGLPVSEFLSMNETASLLGVSRATINRLIDKGELPASKIGAQVRIRRSDVDVLFARRLRRTSA